MEVIEGFRYSNAAGAADIDETSIPALSPMYADAAAMIAALGNGATYITFDERVHGRPFRCDLSAGLVGSSGDTAEEELYLVRSASLDGKASLLVEKLADITWTAGSTAIDSALGGRANHKWPASVSLTDTGLAASRSGVALGSISQVPATVTIFDAGNPTGLLRVMKVGASNPVTGVAPMHTRWR